MSTTEIANTYGHYKSRCENCGTVWLTDELEAIQDIGDRIAAGEIVPAGQCPKEDCGALCHIIKDLLWRCDECGCTDLQEDAWLMVNTQQHTGGDGPVDQIYCPQCSWWTGEGETKATQDAHAPCPYDEKRVDPKTEGTA